VTGRHWLPAIGIGIATLSGSLAAQADVPPDDQALFHDAVLRMQEGKAGEAIADFEALADHGVRDASVSFDRALAYLARVRIGAEQPGDLGEAAEALVEARNLTDDHALSSEATRALGLVRTEVGRRRVRAGEAVEFDPGVALGPAFLGLLPEDGWALVAVFGGVLLSLALFVARGTKERQLRVGATVAAGIATLFACVGATSMLAARAHRMEVTPGVIVTAGARPTDERGLVIPSAPIVPEAAEVEIFGRRGGWVHIRWGNTVAWLPSASVRPLAT
jgi:hypothetical protein